LLAAGFEFPQASDFGIVCGHDNFATDVMRDAVFAAKFRHLADAAHGHLGFERAGFVVESAMEDAAVVGALVFSRPVLFFEHADGEVRLFQ